MMGSIKPVRICHLAVSYYHLELLSGCLDYDDGSLKELVLINRWVDGLYGGTYVGWGGDYGGAGVI